jgi:hypothetical protein
MMTNSTARPFNFYTGLFLVTAGTLMLQLIQTRILSVVAWYHLAFFVISMAMFGLTGGAVWVYLRGTRFSERTLSHDLCYFSTALAVSVALCLATQMTLVPVAAKSLTSIWTWMELAVCIAVPFFFSGVVVSLALTRSPFPIGRVYGVDLIGAAVGCLGVIALLDLTDGPSAALWVSALVAAAALFFSRSNIGAAPEQSPPLAALLNRRKTILVLLIAAATLNGLTFAGLQPMVVKGSFENIYTHIFREWNTFSRVAVYEEAKNVTPAMWGASAKFPGWKTDHRVMNIDGDAGTTMYRFKGNLGEVEFLKYDITNLPYFLPDRRKAAVIGVGGGRDMLSAALFGVRDIVGVEINPIFVKLLTRAPGFIEFNQLARRDGVRFVVDEGRSWFARTDENFDIIQMSLIDTWAATGAGAFTLSENGLYTVQAMRIFLSKLTPGGVFSVSRWYSPARVQETGRMLSLTVAALLELGVKNPQQHIFLASQGRVATLLVSRQPLASVDVAALERAAADLEYRVIVSPATRSEVETLANIVSAATRQELEQYTGNLSLDLTPPTDNRPFFFNQFPLHKPLEAVKFFREMYGRGGYGGVYEGNLAATGTLVILFGIALVLVVATIVVPLRPAVAQVGRRLALGGTLYFALIGVGFMMAEIAMLQRMSVFLGHPMYSLSVILFTLILTTGLGSLLSDQWPLNTRRRFAVWALSVGTYLTLFAVWIGELALAFDHASLLTRAAICAAAVTPAGVLMGFGFPTGMRLVAATDPKPTPWFWGINGAAGVLASIVAIATSIAFGIDTTLGIGALCYFLLIIPALGFMWTPKRS